MEFQDLLHRASSGGGILFCGAGFSADCMNFLESKDLGAGAALLEAINTALKDDIQRPFGDLKNAADKFVSLRGWNKFLPFLHDRYRVSHIPDDMIELIRFPWDRIYTTNYDNAIQAAFTQAA